MQPRPASFPLRSVLSQSLASIATSFRRYHYIHTFPYGMARHTIPHHHHQGTLTPRSGHSQNRSDKRATAAALHIPLPQGKLWQGATLIPLSPREQKCHTTYKEPERKGGRGTMSIQG